MSEEEKLAGWMDAGVELAGEGPGLKKLIQAAYWGMLEAAAFVDSEVYGFYGLMEERFDAVAALDKFPDLL